MAIETNVASSKLQLKYDYGVDGEGKAVSKSKTYANLNKETTDQVKYDVSMAMAALQANPLEEVHVIQDSVLINVI